METLVPGRMPRAGLLLLPLLLCFRPETAGSIDPTALKAIVDHVHKYRPVTRPTPTHQYAVAISLPQSMCNSTNSTELEEHLPMAELQAMKSKLETDLLYEGPHVAAAARPEKSDESGTQYRHSEWLMFQLDQNRMSPVSRLLDKSQNQTKCQKTHALKEMHGNNRYTRYFPNNPCGWNRCFIFFTYYSPCLGTCLSLKDDHRIQDLMDGIFSALDRDYRALAFKEVFKKDRREGKQLVWNSWQTLCKVPLYQCDDQGCQSCEEKDVNKNSCLTTVKNPATKDPKIAHG